jgi:hypothetical protein
MHHIEHPQLAGVAGWLQAGCSHIFKRLQPENAAATTAYAAVAGVAGANAMFPHVRDA